MTPCHGQTQDMVKASDLVDQLKTVLGASTHVELVVALASRGIEVNETRISNWSNNKAGPRWEMTIELLQIAGWLSTNGDAHVHAAQPRDPLATLAATVVEIAETQKQILERLPAPALAPASTPRAAPKRRAKRS